MTKEAANSVLSTPPASRPALVLSPWVQVLIIAAVYVIAARMGLQLASVHGNVSPLWPASGVAIAALLQFGPKARIGIAAGAFAASALTSIPLYAAAGIAIGNTLEACVGARLCHGIAMQRKALGVFARPTSFLVAAIVAPLVAALAGVLTLTLAGLMRLDLAPELGLTWWAGDAIGALVFAPLLLAIPEAWTALRRPTARELARLAFTVGVGVAFCKVAFDGGVGSMLQFLVFPFVLMSAAWFGRCGALVSASSIVSYAVAATAVSTAGGDTHFNSNLLLLEVFLAAVAITAVFLGEFLRVIASPLPLIVMVSGWSLSGWLFTSLEQGGTRFDHLRLERLVHEAEYAIKQRLTTYVDALRGGAGLYAASRSVEYAEWRAYAESLDMVNRYPGINGIGVVKPVRLDQLDAFLAATRADDQPEFRVRSATGAAQPVAEPGEAEQFVVTFIEPLETNGGELGLDVGSDAIRRTAACAARDTGRPVITANLELSPYGVRRPSFLLYVPMYGKGMHPQDTAERRRDFTGWIYAPIITEAFLRGVLGSGSQIDLDFYSGNEVASAELHFCSTGRPRPHRGGYELCTHVELGGRPFTLGWHRTQAFVTTGQTAAIFSGASLALVSLLLAGFILSLQTMNQRARAIAVERTRELQTANDHLGRQIAEREKAEAEATRARAAAEVASRSKSNFLATMSHEIRTPMNSVIGFTDLLLRSSLTAEQHGWASYIQTSGRTLLSLIDDILDFSKIEAGKMRLEHTPYSPVLGAQEVVGMLAPKADEKQVRLVLDAQSGPERPVLGDRGRFVQVLLNLVSNALKFTLRGEVRVQLSFATESAARGRLHVAVSDTGIGIAADTLPLLFREFSQADSSTTRRFGGTGLGLAVCKRLIELMGGAITVSSEVDRGSTFRFELPLELAPAEVLPGDSMNRRAQPETVQPRGAAAPKPLHVLVADDVAMNQVLVSALLKRHGCAVDVANNGQEAVSMSASVDYDLILMDCQMPEMDGFEATAVIRNRERLAAVDAASRVPIIAVTANALDGDRERCLAAGMDDYLVKPIRLPDFERALHRWAGAAAAERRNPAGG